MSWTLAKMFERTMIERFLIGLVTTKFAIQFQTFQFDYIDFWFIFGFLNQNQNTLFRKKLKCESDRWSFLIETCRLAKVTPSKVTHRPEVLGCLHFVQTCFQRLTVLARPLLCIFSCRLFQPYIVRVHLFPARLESNWFSSTGAPFSSIEISDTFSAIDTFSVYCHHHTIITPCVFS